MESKKKSLSLMKSKIADDASDPREYGVLAKNDAKREETMTKVNISAKNRIAKESLKLTLSQWIVESRRRFSPDQIIRESQLLGFNLRITDWPDLLFASGYHVPPAYTFNAKFINDILEGTKYLIWTTRVNYIAIPKSYTKQLLITTLMTLGCIDVVRQVLPGDPASSTKEYLVQAANSLIFTENGETRERTPIFNRIFRLITSREDWFRSQGQAIPSPTQLLVAVLDVLAEDVTSELVWLGRGDFRITALDVNL